MKYNFKGKEVTIHDKLVPFVERGLCDTIDDHYFNHNLCVAFGGDYDIDQISGKKISEITQELILGELEDCHDITFDQDFNAFLRGEPFTLPE